MTAARLAREFRFKERQDYVSRLAGPLELGVIGLLVSSGLAAQQTSGVRSSSAEATGLIVGQVVDGTTGRPVPEALVNLLPAAVRNSAASAAATSSMPVIADPTGRFFFSGLPAGRYSLRVAKPGYVESGGVQRQPSSPPAPIDVGDDQKILDLKIPIWKFGTISGTVLDEAGEPVIGVEVSALRRTFVGGRPRFSIVLPNLGTTDDRGAYRLPSLAQGDYVVVVPSTQTTFPPSVLIAAQGGNIAPEMSSVARSWSVLGMPRTQQIGDWVLIAGSRAPLVPAPSGGRLHIYPRTFHPSSTAWPSAAIISLGSGEERIADIRVQLMSAVAVSGTIAGPNGPLPRTALRLVPAGQDEWSADADQEAATGLTNDRGAFTLLGVLPGQYLLKVLTPRFRGNAPTPPSTDRQPVLWATEPLTVGDTDVSGVTITTRPTLTISGSILLEGTASFPPSNRDTGLRVRVESTSGGPSAIAPIDAQRNFTTGVPGGTYAVSVDTPAGWRLKSVRFNGTDTTDRPIEMRTDSSLVFVMTDQATQLSGVVRDENGNPDAFGEVAIFPANRQWWTGYGSTAGRIKSATALASGVYTLADMLAGEYFVTSLPDSLADRWMAPSNLDALSRTAVRVTIADGEKRTQDLRKVVAR